MDDQYVGRDAKKRKTDGGECPQSSGLMKMMASMQGEMLSMRRRMDEMEIRLRKCDRLEAECESLRSRLGETAGMIARMGELQAERVGSLSDSLEESVDAKLRFHKQLIDNQRWEYSAPPVDPSYWAERGYDADEERAITEMISRMRETTTKMRRGERFYGGIGVRSGLEDGALPCDGALQGHWKEFADALSQYRRYLDQCPDGDEPSLDFRNVQLVPEVLDMLETALREVGFEELELEHNDAGRDLVSFVTRVLENNDHCRVLSLRGNQFKSRDDDLQLQERNNVLWETIANHPSLRELNMGKCFNSSPRSLLGEALPKFRNLTHLELMSNEIRGESAAHIADFLETNPSLVHLEMSCNPIGDDDAAKIARALVRNDTLRLLEMEVNDSMTEAGARALRGTVYGDGDDLNSIACSNHTCQIRSGWGHTQCNGHEDAPRLNRRWKLYDTLNYHHVKFSNVVEIVDDQLPDGRTDFARRLMPKVLESIQLYADLREKKNHPTMCFVEPLSIVYDIMKGWRMPSLYEK